MDYSIGTASTGQFHALGYVGECWLLHLHETPFATANFEPPRCEVCLFFFFNQKAEWVKWQKTKVTFEYTFVYGNVMVVWSIFVWVWLLGSLFGPLDSVWSVGRWFGNSGRAAGYSGASLRIRETVSSQITMWLFCMPVFWHILDIPPLCAPCSHTTVIRMFIWILLK